MLKGIPDIISPELLKVLHEMGHGDDLVIGDANFPAASNSAALAFISFAPSSAADRVMYIPASLTYISVGNPPACRPRCAE